MAPHQLSRTVAPDCASVSESAVLLGVTEKHIRNLIDRGDLAAIRVGAAIRVPLAALRNLPRVAPSKEAA